MSLVGSLEDLGLGDILQIVSLSRKSGVLSLTVGQEKGQIIFKDGQVVSALSNNPRFNLVSDFINRRLVTPDQVRAYEVQRQATGKSLVGALTDDPSVSNEALQETIRDFVERIVFGFFEWEQGNFNFEVRDISQEFAALDDAARELILEVGLNPQFLAMEGTRLQDEKKRDASLAGEGVDGSMTPMPSHCSARW